MSGSDCLMSLTVPLTCSPIDRDSYITTCVCSFLRVGYTFHYRTVFLFQRRCDSTACLLLLASACLIVYSARILYTLNTYYHSPRYAFAPDSCGRHRLFMFQNTHLIASNILYRDSIDDALSIGFYLYALHIHFHMYTLGWLAVTVGTQFPHFSTSYLQRRFFPMRGH